ncbi:MAG: peroxiredoxin [Pirellulales bacterium]|nr:peroxiredoxin [Pirellulales bacterium]
MTAKLHVGDVAPDFAVMTSAGVELRLSDFRGQRAVVLFFYPKNGTTVCTQEACSFRDSFETFAEAGAEVIGVSGDSDDSHRSFAARHRLPFHLVSDRDGRLQKLYGARKALGILPGRVTFVIDREGVIRHMFSALFASDEHVRQSLAALEHA